MDSGMARLETTQSVQAVIYTRVSSKEQEKEGFSIPAQQKLLRGYAAEQRFDVIRDFVDIETAKRAGRTAFGEMIAFLKRNAKCRTVLVEKTDRLYRNLKDYVILDDLDLDIHLVKKGQILSHDSRSSEKFMHGIKVLMAKNYIDNLSEEARKGMLEKAEQGIWPSYAPLGYKNVEGAHGKKVIVPDPACAPLVTRLYLLCAQGTHSVKELAKLLAGEGLRYRSGNVMNTATVHKVLRNRIYSGEFDWAGRVFQGTHEPLVTRELWNHVQATLDRRLATRGKKTEHGFPYAGLLRCGHCGCSLVGEIKKQKYVYYHCTGFKGKCQEPYLRQEALEAEFSRWLRKLALDQEVVEWISTALRESQADKRQHHEAAVSRLKADHQRLLNRLEALYEDKLDGRIDVAFFDRKSREWRSEQNRLLDAIKEHETANESYMEEGIRILELAQRAGDLFDKQPAHEKRRLLDCVMSGASLKDSALTIEFRQPFDMLLDATIAVEKEQAAAENSGTENGRLSNSANTSKHEANAHSKGRFENWLPLVDTFRTVSLQAQVLTSAAMVRP
jgi:site-specific DNA recombinase